MVSFSCITLTTGARQLVVHEAAVMIFMSPVFIYNRTFSIFSLYLIPVVKLKHTGDLIAVYSHYDVEDSFLHGRTDDDAVDAVVKIRLQRCYRKEVACALCSLTRSWC
jgi:hypothetical protein